MQNIIFGVIIWLALVVWVLVDAQTHKVRKIFWPLVTLFTGPLGLVAYGIVSEMTKKENA